MQEPFLFQPSGRLIDFMRQADEPGLINFAAGVPSSDALPQEPLKQAFLKAFEREVKTIFAYHHPEGDHLLRALLADRLNRRGTNVQASDIVVTTGCTQALQVMLSILVKPGDIVACEAPAYYGLLELLSQAGARILPIPVKDENGMDLDQAKVLLEKWKPRVLVVCSSLSNPSGATMPENNRKRMVELCRNHRVRIIEDDIYAELVDGGAPKPLRSFDDGSTVSYVSSFSKSVAPGIRVGFCVPGTLFEAFATLKVQQDLHSCVVSEVALRTFLEMDALEKHLRWLRERNMSRRRTAIEAIETSFPKGSRISRNQGGFMLWVELPKEINLAHAKEMAHRKRIAFAAGQVFFAHPVPGKYMRLNCAKASEEDLATGLKTLGMIVSEISNITS